MKTWQDVQVRLKNEMKTWFNRQVHNPYGAYYLYYCEANAEHDGGLLICEEAPPNKGYVLADPRRIMPGQTIEINYTMFLETCRRLPILTV